MCIDVESRRGWGRIGVGFLLAPTIFSACGGRMIPEADGGETPTPVSPLGAVGSDDGGADPFPVCPALPPEIGSSCTMPPDEGCTYQEYSGYGWSCTSFVCSSGTWLKVGGGC